MCGIVGYVGGRDSAEVLLDGLSSLEYRGYDSAGIAVFEKDSIKVVKSKGRLKNLRDKLEAEGTPSGSCGIGHTRWATHGAPSDVNAHPHSGERVTIVHNGIIENYSEIKKKLIEKGCRFESDTDTEVAAKLIDYYYQSDPFEAIRKALLRIRGSYAFGILFREYPNRIYAVRKDSPLIVGAGKGENFIASDVPAILKYTREYYLLEENEVAVLTGDEVNIFDIGGEPVKKEKLTANWDVAAAEKGGFEHFMLKEIYDQPKAIRDTVSPRLIGGLPAFNEGMHGADCFEHVGKVRIVACGTAMHAGMVGKYAVESLARIPVEVDIASEFRYRNPIFASDELVVIISQSGETADTLAALRLAKGQGIRTLAIVNVVGSSIAREADGVIYTWAGPEIAVASTKAYSVQLSVMYLFAIRLALAAGAMNESEAASLCKEIEKLPDVVQKLLCCKEQCQHLASLYQNSRSLFFIGRGMDYASSMEGSLKLKEISYLHSEAYAAGELKHGTISLIVDGTPVVAVATQKNLFEKTVSNIKEVKARGAHVLLVCREGEKEVDKIVDHVIELPNMPDILMPSLSVIPLQLFAYYMAVERGCDVDKPRNLAKSVTVE
ncbi:MAG TPA: glutamine--fructose-6-phosphate transaminase (isomerizing) [Clostridia bacterium]|nr:glutamine--fructose-6-phosphate transaminase (isomerizing) [Clostridia bacterium]